MSKVPEAIVNMACDHLDRRHRKLNDILHNARYYQQEAEGAAQKAREFLAEYEEATRQKEQIRQWLAENAPDQVKFL